jgi:copper transport protein
MRRLLVVGTMTLGLVLAWTLPAAAHANLASSDPADGAELAGAPAQVTMTFTEPPDSELSKVLVLNAAGQEVQSGPAAAGPEPRSLVVPLPGDLPDGVYTVSWQVVSTADGHLTANAFSFGVGVAPGAGSTAPPHATSPSPSVLSILGRTSLYVGITMAIGTAFAGLWTIGAALRGRRWLPIASGVLIAGGTVCMVTAERSTVGVSLRQLLSSSAGKDYVWLIAAASVAMVCGVIAGLTRSWPPLALLGAAGIATALVRALGGHAAAASPAWPQELLQTVHITAASIWVGGFVPVLLLLAAWRSRRSTREGRAAPPVDEVARFSRAAGWAVLVLVMTGLLREVNEAGGLGKVLDLLLDSSYGTALLIKMAIVVAMIGLGWLNRRRSIPRLRAGDGTLARVMSIEVVAAVAVLAVTATLTGLNPEPNTATAPAAPARVTASGSDFATTMRVELTATPGTPGRNEFRVEVNDFDSGDPLTASAVTLRFEPVGRPNVQQSQLDLTRTGDGGWTGSGTQLSLAGVWNVTALVQTGARATEVPLTLVTRAPGGQRTSVASQAGLPDITTITLASGQQIQAYADPGTAGPNEVHVTAFDASGQELPLKDMLVVATPNGGDPRALDEKRLTAGHFSAAADLTAGEWRFDIVATSKDGQVLQVWFNQGIGQGSP